MSELLVIASTVTACSLAASPLRKLHAFDERHLMTLHDSVTGLCMSTDIRERIAQNVDLFLDKPMPPSRKGMSDLPEEVIRKYDNLAAFCVICYAGVERAGSHSEARSLYSQTPDIAR